MNESYKVVCLWQNDSVTVEYEGKWFTQAHDAGQRALENGAIFAELETLQNGKTAGFLTIEHPAQS